MVIRALLAVSLGSSLFGCGFPSPKFGATTSEGVATADFLIRARHTDTVTVHVWFPADANGEPVVGPSPRRAVVFIQGGAVAPLRYAWLADALAQRGYVVAVPEHVLNLAYFEIDSGLAVRDLLARPPKGSLLEGLVDPARIAVAGHSLGGVVASKLALSRQFGALVLGAAYPERSDEDALKALALPSLSVTGRADCQATLEEVSTGALLLPRPRILAVVDGMTHFQFTDSDKQDSDAKCAPTVDLTTAHTTIVELMSRFLVSALDSGDGQVGPLNGIAGVKVSAP